MKSVIFSSVAALMFASAFADAKIDRVLVRQQWPWNEKVAIDFVLTNVTSATEINCAVYRGETPVSVPAGAFIGDFCNLEKDGAYRIMFDPSYLSDRPSKGETLRFVLTPSAMSDDSPYNEVLYKIFDLENPSVTDVTRGDLLSGRYGSVETDYSRIGEGYSSPLSNVLIWTGVTNYPGAKTTKLVMRKIPAGNFMYPGSGNWGSWNYPFKVSKEFYIGVFELTQKQYSYFTVTTASKDDIDPPAYNAGDDKPLSNFSPLRIFYGDSRDVWDASKGALKILKELFANAGAGTYYFDLPSQAMWLRAMEAGSVTGQDGAYYYDGINGVPTDFDNNPRMAVLGRFAGNGGIVDNGDGTKTTNGVASVGSYRPNAFGLYDMIGNVRETFRDKGGHFTYTIHSENPTDTYISPGGFTAAMGAFGESWSRKGTLWLSSEPSFNLSSPNKYPDLGVRLAFFEGENPFKPKPTE